MSPVVSGRAETVPDHTEIRRAEWLAIAVIVLAAAVLRLAGLQWMEFKGDEAVALQLAGKMLDGGGLARTGLMSSVGIPNPPVFLYWIAAVMAVSRDPVVVTALAVAFPAIGAVFVTWWILRHRAGIWLRLGAAGLMAVSPWAVLYSRKIWAQDTMPLLGALLLGALFSVAERSRTRAVVFVPVLIALLWQIHFSATGLALVAGIVLAWRAKHLHWAALAAGIALAIATLAPYLSHLYETNFADLDRVAGRPSPESDPSARVGLAEVADAAIRHTTAISAGTDLGYALGRRSQAELSARSGGTALAFLASASGALGNVCLAFGLVVFLVRGWRGGAHAPHQRVASIWMLVFAVYLWIGDVRQIYPHYFVALYPVPFLLLAAPAAELAQRGERWGRFAAAGVLAILAAGQLASLGIFSAYIRDRGGTAGDYGVAYRYKVELIDWAIREDRALTGRRGREYSYLLQTRRAGDGGARGRFAVLDHLRRGPAVPSQCTSTEAFGPLSACVLD